MIRIDGPGKAGGASGGQAPRRSGASTFRLPEDAKATSGGLSVGGTLPLGALVALQAVEDPLERRRRSVKRGTAMLDELDQMKLDLLAGRLSPERIARLAQLIQSREPSGNDSLDQVLDDIDLRVKVELAKHGHFLD